YSFLHPQYRPRKKKTEPFTAWGISQGHFLFSPRSPSLDRRQSSHVKRVGYLCCLLKKTQAAAHTKNQ
ncbi:hypothetical protein, partial [Enterobacter hormaechei]